MARSSTKKPTSRSAPAAASRSKSTARTTSRAPARANGARRAGADPAASSAREVWGIGLLVMAVLAALGVWFDRAGSLGTYLFLLFRGLFGVFGLLAPVVLAAVGVTLLRAKRRGNARVAVGVAITLVATSGLWHLAAGAPSFDARLRGLHRSGGWLGALASLPLQSVAATAGAVVLLLALLCLGLLVTTATPPGTVIHAATGAWASLRDQVVERRERRRLAAEEAAEARQAQEASQAGEGAGGDGAPPPDEDAGDAETVVVYDDPDATGPIYTGHVDTGTATAVATEDDPAPSDTRLLPAGLRTNGAAATKLGPPAVQDPWADYELPSLSLLRSGRAAPGNKRTLDQMTRALEHTLHQFGVDARVARVTRGPTVTRFELSLGDGVRVGAVTKLGDDISYALATAEIRIVAPIPGKSAIGIEVPNRDRDLITLGDVLRSPEAANQHHPLTAGIGVDIAGNPVLVNLATMPHLLIAGATGSGKSVTMNDIVTSVVMRSSPAQARMILIDPKRVELNHYEGVPHLLTPVVTDPKRATEALAWTVKEMEERYERLALLGYRNIDTYNSAVRDGTIRAAPALSGRSDETWQLLPYVLLVIDELADLMMVAPRDVEGAIVRIAQMARAVGIHLVVATQRPSVDVVTGLIKANIPSRIALAMATHADSRTILDSGGAEKLVGHGDMLFLPANASKAHRLQGCFIDEAEIEPIVGHCKRQRQADYTAGIVRSGTQATFADVTGDDASDEALTRAAMDLVVRSGLGSTSMLQRKLKVGFARAGRLMDELETMGVVGPSEGPKARTVLMSVDELEQRDPQNA
jgi:S-DNA-T family DNA segregation ATPase FtsK/SpoIIIE